MDKYEQWRNLELSDVNNYNSNDFVFFVHAIDFEEKYLPQDELQAELEKHPDSRIKLNQNINLAKEPNRIHEKEIISCSLISSKNRYPTYKPIGYILEFPVENIICANDEDMMTDFYDFEGLIKKYEKELLPTPNIFIDRPKYTGWGYDIHNEIVVRGTTSTGKVKIIGVFVNVNDIGSSNCDYSKRVCDLANRLAQKLNVPLIELPVVDKLDMSNQVGRIK